MFISRSRLQHRSRGSIIFFFFFSSRVAFAPTVLTVSFEPAMVARNGLRPLLRQTQRIFVAHQFGGASFSSTDNLQNLSAWVGMPNAILRSRLLQLPGRPLGLLPFRGLFQDSPTIPTTESTPLLSLVEQISGPVREKLAGCPVAAMESRMTGGQTQLPENLPPDACLLRPFISTRPVLTTHTPDPHLRRGRFRWGPEIAIDRRIRTGLMKQGLVAGFWFINPVVF